MGVRFACHGCGNSLNIKTQLAGKRGKCPHCNIRFRIPLHDQDYSIPVNSPATSAATAEAASQPTGNSTKTAEADPPPKAAPDRSRAERVDPPSPRPAGSAAGQSASSEPAQKRAGASAPSPNLATAASPATPSQGDSTDFDLLAEPGIQWYVRPPAGGRFGPAEGATVRAWIGEGRVTPETLLWRDGWPQWRECREVVPEMDRPAASTLPPAARPVAVPVSMPRAADPAGSASGNSGSGRGFNDRDTYLAEKKRLKAKRRTTAIAVLVAVSLLLLAGLVIALTLPPSDEEVSSQTQSNPVRPVIAKPNSPSGTSALSNLRMRMVGQFAKRGQAPKMRSTLRAIWFLEPDPFLQV